MAMGARHSLIVRAAQLIAGVRQVWRDELSDKAQLLETFDQYRDALFANDVQLMKMLMAEEYIGFDPQGNPQDLKMTIDAYQTGAVTLNRYDTEEVEARVIGEVGIIAGKGYIQGIVAGLEFEHNLRFLDLYILRDGRWQLYMSQVTPLGAV